MDDLVNLFDSEGLKPAKILEVSPRSHQNVVFFKKRKPQIQQIQGFHVIFGRAEDGT